MPSFNPIDLGYATVSDANDVISLTTIADAPAGSTIVVVVEVNFGPPLSSTLALSDGVNTYTSRRVTNSIFAEKLFSQDSQNIGALLPTGTVITGTLSYTVSPPGVTHRKSIQVIAIPETVGGVFPFPPTVSGASADGSGFFNNPPSSALVTIGITGPNAPPAGPYLMLAFAAHDSNFPTVNTPTNFVWTAGPTIIRDGVPLCTAHQETSVVFPATAGMSGTLSMTPSGGFGLADIGWVILTYYLPAPPERLSVAQGPSGRRLRAGSLNGVLSANRFNDSFPATVTATVTVEASLAAAGSIVYLGSKAEVVYVKSGDVILKRSFDHGRTWSVAETIATGYQDATQVVDEKRGLRVVLMWKESASQWWITIGTLDSGGTTWSYTTPALLVSSAKRGGCLTRRRDGVLEFDYRNTSDAIVVLRCKVLPKAGPGTWA